MKVDLVYPVRPSMHDGPQELRYSLRAVAHHVKDVGRTFIVGHRPSYINWEEVVHVPSDQLPGRRARFINQRRNLEALFESDAGPLVAWMADDMFFQHDVELAAWPLAHRGFLSDYIEGGGGEVVIPPSGEYLEGVQRCYDLLRSWGYEAPLMTATHTPLVIDLPQLRKTMERAWSEGQEDGFMRLLIQPETEKGGVQIVDPKVRASDMPELEWPMFSTCASSWARRAGATVKSRYWRPSRYEIAPQPKPSPGSFPPGGAARIRPQGGPPWLNMSSSSIQRPGPR